MKWDRWSETPDLAQSNQWTKIVWISFKLHNSSNSTWHKILNNIKWILETSQWTTAATTTWNTTVVETNKTTEAVCKRWVMSSLQQVNSSSISKVTCNKINNSETRQTSHNHKLHSNRLFLNSQLSRLLRLWFLFLKWTQPKLPKWTLILEETLLVMQSIHPSRRFSEKNMLEKSLVCS